MKNLKSIISLIVATSSVNAFAAEHIEPSMVNIPAGEFMMGSDSGGALVKPMHQASVSAFQMAKYPITVAEFRQFAKDTGFAPKPSCTDHIDENWLGGPDTVGTASWNQHRYLKSDFQPVTCITWQDANTYVEWLSKKTGKTYRLPTEQEFEYALKANTTSRYFWGDDPNNTQACAYGNFADLAGEYFASEQYGASYTGFVGHANCNDGEPYISIVGLYRPNPFGLYDMVGNVSQYLNSCFYEGYQARSTEEMDINKCEFVAHRGESWHYPPQPHADRGRYKKGGAPGALMGFRLAADGHSAANLDMHDLAEKPSVTKTKFEAALAQAQSKRLATRPVLPLAPMSPQLTKVKGKEFMLSWQPSTSPDVTSYHVYQSHTLYAHRFGRHYKRYYDKIQTVNADSNSVKVTLGDVRHSFRIVAVTEKLTSLPSPPAIVAHSKTLAIPGRLYMQESAALENVRIAYSTQEDDPEPYYLSKVNHSLEQPLVTTTFNVKVQESGWYTLNYRGRSIMTGTFFKLWQNNKLVGEISYDPDIDDKTSDRHKVFLEQGEHQLQMSVTREGFDYWSMTWLELNKAKS